MFGKKKRGSFSVYELYLTRAGHEIGEGCYTSPDGVVDQDGPRRTLVTPNDFSVRRDTRLRIGTSPSPHAFRGTKGNYKTVKIYDNTN